MRGFCYYLLTHKMFIRPEIYALLFSSTWFSKSNFTCLDSCHGEFNINIHKAGMLFFAAIDLLIVSSSSHPEVSRVKGTPLRKRINKVHFRCLITIWSIGIARRGFKYNYITHNYIFRL